MLSWKIGHSLDPYLRAMVRWAIRRPINPNIFTFGGLLLSAVAGMLLAFGLWFVAGWVILVAGLCDLLDGAMARGRGEVRPFGSFLDSVSDRYSDLFLFLGILVFYVRGHNPTMIILTIVTLSGAVMVPYTRAKAETLIPKCNVGLVERAERILAITAGALFDCMVPVLWGLAILTHFTVVHRIYHTWREINRSQTV